jgi:peptidoglycan/xylan/chitin deacetylase (PgdA/CDA1 family)
MKKSNKMRFNDHFGKIAGLIPFHSLQKIQAHRTIVPVYHAVSDKELPHISQLYKVKTISEFQTELDFLQKYYRAIEPEELLHGRNKIKKSEKPGFLLSFDDGLSEVYTVIAPILMERGLSAIFFLNTAFIDNKALFYRYKQSLLTHYVKKIYPQNSTQHDKFQKEVLPKLSYRDFEAGDNLANELQLDFNEFLQNQKPYLNTDQINELANSGFYFGAHSIDHPLFSEIGLHEQIRQCTESMEKVQKIIPQSIRMFAFPFTDAGVSTDFFEKTKNSVDLYFGTAGLKDDPIHRSIQRIPMESDRISGKKIIPQEYLYYALKRILNRNKIIRG